MIIKPRNIPLEIQRLKALERRLPRNHPQFQSVADQLGRSLAGLNGEQSLDFPLSFLSPEKYHLLHSLRLHDGIRFFQLDTLILSPQFILILEVKNYSGTVIFNTEFDQIIRIKDGVEEAFPNPIIQITRQQDQLRHWMQTQLGMSMMVEALVVFANERTVLKSTESDQETKMKVTNRSALPYRIKELEKKHQHNKGQELTTLRSRLLDAHQIMDKDILEKFHIRKQEILTGAACPSCDYIPMERNSRVWNCPSCGAASHDAHIQALKDYYHLIAPTISNREARTFLNISSRHVVNRFFHNLKCESIGHHKSTRYSLHSLNDE